MDHLNGPPDLAQRVHLPEFPVILAGMVGELTVRLTVGDPYGRGRMGWKPTVFRHFPRRETTHVYSVGVLTIASTLPR